MSDLTNGKIKEWPVSLMIERDLGGQAFGAQCAAYTGENDEPAPDDVQRACEDITDACKGLSPAVALRKAISLGFVPDEEQP